MSLIHEYKDGEAGVLGFLREFRNGERIFRAEEFPSQLPVLQHWGVKDFAIRYRLGGIEHVLERADALARLEEKAQTLRDLKSRQEAMGRERQIHQLQVMKQAVTGENEPALIVPGAIGQCWHQL
ncbi:hypothetical protein [Cupriavidus sp. D39]|uniref:hypothetical protein n=1 Tax=Cupriavidus sp. D39 TaxID=2997877 RepID=UPI002271AFC5|nr:hypothetical protein [Cupriavidus sp. D39]MCY0858669.1 hypothetical protein [Cupriavidus sp. D39]